MGLLIASLALRGLTWLTAEGAGLAKHTEATPDDVTRLGKPLTLAAEGRRPALRVTALSAKRITLPSGAYVGEPGLRLVAVDLRIANRGNTAWSLVTSGMSESVADTTGTHYTPAIVTAKVPGRLARDATVLPHRAVRGRVIFAVPKRARLTEVRVNLGLGSSRTLHWELP